MRGSPLCSTCLPAAEQMVRFSRQILLVYCGVSYAALQLRKVNRTLPACKGRLECGSRLHQVLVGRTCSSKAHCSKPDISNEMAQFLIGALPLKKMIRS